MAQRLLQDQCISFASLTARGYDQDIIVRGEVTVAGQS
jgi:hypothetical protein